MLEGLSEPQELAALSQTSMNSEKPQKLQNPVVETIANHWPIPFYFLPQQIVRIDKTNKQTKKFPHLFRPGLLAVMTTDFYMAFD